VKRKRKGGRGKGTIYSFGEKEGGKKIEGEKRKRVGFRGKKNGRKVMLIPPMGEKGEREETLCSEKKKKGKKNLYYNPCGGGEGKRKTFYNSSVMEKKESCRSEKKGKILISTRVSGRKRKKGRGTSSNLKEKKERGEKKIFKRRGEKTLVHHESLERKEKNTTD